MKCMNILLLLFTSLASKAQVGISSVPSSPDPSSMLDIKSTTTGMLCPRMKEIERNSIILPAHSLLIYQTDIVPGYYYNEGSPSTPLWVKLETNLSSLEHIGRIPIDSLPYTISNSGSYYLTKNLTGTTGIKISTSNVSIDLNGHSIKGLPGNISAGILEVGTQKGIMISNGFIMDWTKEGINFSTSFNCSFINLIITGSGLDGLFSGRNSYVSQVTASSNTFDGIDVAESSVVDHCIAEANVSDGIEVDHGSVINECSAKSNGGVGLKSTNVASITSCSSYSNTSHGFSCGNGSILTNNSSANNVGSGFYIQASCQVFNNSSRANLKYGFELAGNDNTIQNNDAHSNSFSGYYTNFDRNNFENNTSSSNVQHGYQITGTSCLIIKNKASTNSISNFNVGVGNILATVIDNTTINTNTNPNANISF